MKIIYVGSPELFGTGASSIHVAKMVEAFADNGHDVDLILPIKKEEINKFYDYYSVKRNFNIKRKFGFRAGSLRHFLHGILSIFSIYPDYDFIVTRNITFAYIASFFFKNIIIDIHHPPINLFSKIAIRRFINSKNILKITFNSQGTLEEVVKNSDRNEKYLVCHNGVDLRQFKIKHDTLSIKKKYNINNDKKIITYIGNIYRGRGIEKIIDLAKDMPEFMFMIVGGSNNEVDEYKRLMPDNIENIFFLGFINHKYIPEIYSISDIMLIPYDDDFTIKGNTDASKFSSPIKIFEHLASGKPIVASKIKSIEEILENNIDSILVNAESLLSYKQAIKKILYDNKMYDEISKKALLKSKKHSWKKRAEKIISI